MICALRSPVSPSASGPKDHIPTPSIPAEDVGDDAAELLCRPCAVDDLAGDPEREGHAAAQRPRALPDVYVPTKAEVERHNLTHLPYRNWCRICVAGKKPNTPHRSLPPYSRRIPLLVLDYASLRAKDDTVLLTMCSGRLYPWRDVASIVCETK